MTFTEIGRLKGMTPDSVRRAVARFTRREMKRSGSHKYIMPPTQLTELQQKVLDLKNSGLTLAEVGAALGRSTNAVSKLLAQAREKTGLVR